MVVVVKAGGSGLFVQVAYESRVPWDWYRQFQLDGEYFANLVSGLTQASIQSPLLFVPGGVGAYLYIGVGERLGLSDDHLNRIGCDILNVTGTIILRALIDREVNVFPALVDVRDDICELSREYRVVIIAASPDFRSTDALAAAAAVKVRARQLLMFKQGVPVFHLGFSRPTSLSRLPVSRLREMLALSEERPGQNAILDSQAVEIVAEANLRTVLYEARDIGCLSDILSSGHWAKSTEITFHGVADDR